MSDEIVFEPEETDVPAPIKAHIERYVGLLRDLHFAFVQNFQDAIEQVQTTVVLGSEDRSAASMLQETARGAISMAARFLLNRVSEVTPGLGTFISLWEKLSPNFSDGRDALGKDVGDWIHDLREVMNAWRSAYNAQTIDEITEEATLAFLEADNPTEVFDALMQAIEALKTASSAVPALRDLETAMYTGWINANFSGFREEGSGVADVRLQAESDKPRLLSCTLQVRFGAKIARRLNLLQGSVVGFDSPLDLAIVKRVAVCAEGLAGGNTWQFGWLDAENLAEHQPITDAGRTAFNDSRWHSDVEKFFEAENDFFDNPSRCSDTGIHTHAD